MTSPLARSEHASLVSPHVKKAQEALHEVADSWCEQTPHSYPGRLGSLGVYTAMSRTLLDRVRERVPIDTYEGRQLLHNSNTSVGFGVTARFMFAGALQASRHNHYMDPETPYTLNDLHRGMYQPASFRQLALLTRETNRSALAIEREMGIVHAEHLDRDAERAMRASFTFSPDHGLTVPEYALHRYRARAAEVDRGNLSTKEAFTADADKDPSRCEAYNTGLLSYIYKHMLDICLKDPTLFEATLAEPPTTFHHNNVAPPSVIRLP